jgi:hypothetical protein
MWSLINTGGGTTFGALNMTTDLSPTFPSGILHFPLIAPTLSHISAKAQSLHLNHIGPPSKERGLSRAVSDHSSSTDSLHN